MIETVLACLSVFATASGVSHCDLRGSRSDLNAALLIGMNCSGFGLLDEPKRCEDAICVVEIMSLNDNTSNVVLLIAIPSFIGYLHPDNSNHEQH